MANLTISYVSLFSSGGHGRQPRTTPASGFAPINGAPSTSLGSFSSGSGYTPSINPWASTNNYSLAFMAAAGGTQPTQISSTIFQVDFGNNDISIILGFVPQGGGNGGGGSGANIDAFDLTTLSLVDNDFVQSITNAAGVTGDTLAAANQQGYLETTNTSVKIVADNPIGANVDGTPQNAPANATFSQWQTVWSSNVQKVPLGTISTTSLTVPEGVSVYSLAVYTNPPTPSKTTTLAVEKLQHPDKANHLIDKVPSPDKNDSFDKQAQDIYKGQHLTEKQTDKPFIGESKQLGDSPQLPGSPHAFALNYQILSQKLADLEANLTPVPRGQAFIKEADRPAVGRTVARQTPKAT